MHPLEDWVIGVRAVHLAACMLLFGELLFALAVQRLPRRGRVTRAAGVAALVTAFAWMVLVTRVISSEAGLDGMSSSMLALAVTQTQFGQAWIARVALLAIALALGNRAPVLAALAAALALALVAGVSHAAAITGAARVVQLASDALHLVAAGAWLGSLPALAVALAHVRSGSQRIALARRWSRTAVVAVAVVLASGIANAAFRLGSIAALTGSDYGQVLVIKLVLVATMLGFALVNRAWLTPRLEAAGAAVMLRRNAAVELGLGLVVLVLAATLATRAPPGHAGMHHPGAASQSSSSAIASTSSCDSFPTSSG